jgi:hypothetical protein
VKAAAAQIAREDRRRRERVEEAADFCADVVLSGWQSMVADRASTYITQATWQQLFRGRHRKRCQALARYAAQLLAGKQAIHAAVGSLAFSLLGRLGSGDFARAMAAELVSSLPLPFDAKIVAAARGLQASGVVLCLANGSALTHCQCLIDLALSETKERVRSILKAATTDWANLRAYPSR